MKPLGRGLGVLLAAILVSGLIMETILRMFFPVYSPAMKNIWVPHPVYGSYHTPGHRSLNSGYGFSAVIESNREGFREREFTPPPAGKKRILFLGDSFTEGAQVDVEKTFPAIVESILNQGTGEYECFNLAIQGHGTGQEYLILRDYADTIQPDIVVLNFFINNDVWDNSYFINYKYEDQGSKNRPLWDMNGDTLRMIPYDYDAVMRGRRQRNPGKKIWRSSYLRNFIYDIKYKLMYNVLGQKKLYKGTLNNLVYYKNYDEGWDEAWTITERLILAARDLAASRGSRFLLVYIPDQIELYNERLQTTIKANPYLKADLLDLEKPWRILRPFLEEHRIEYLNLRERFQSDPRRLYYEFDAHFNEDGHRAAAEAIARKLSDE